MKVISFEDRDQWLAERRGKITGTRLKDLVVKSALTKENIVTQLEEGKVEFDAKAKVSDLAALLTPKMKANIMLSADKKIGFYELIAERLAIPPDDENCMDRGLRLEEEAAEKFTAETGKKLNTNLVIWTREDNDSIGLSPDGFTEDLKEAAEIKCLGSARHLEAILTEKIPADYWEQVLQYFIVNDKLEVLHFIFYDPRIVAKDYFRIEVNKKDVQEIVNEYLELEKQTLSEIDEIVLKLSDF